jgi:hypothetical protein
MGNRICEVCGGSHLRPVECPGDLRPTGPERPSWRVEVDTPKGIEAFGVLVAPSYDHWRARILTYPNVLWLGSDGRTTLKFGGRTAREAEAGAIAFIESHCRSRGYQVRTALAPVTATGSSLAAFLAAERNRPTAVAPRKSIAIPLRYGPVRPVDPGMTVNLSETGLFVCTRRLLEPGSAVALDLFLRDARPKLRGVVVWSRPIPKPGLPNGMGVRLLAPPPAYTSYVGAL